MTADLLDPLRPVAERLGWTLVHSVWEGAAAAAMLWPALALTPRAAARIRYLFACAAMAGVAIAMAVTFARVHVTATSPSPVLSGTTAVTASSPPTLPIAAPAFALPADDRPVAPDVRRRIEPYLPAVTTLWVLGVVVLACWHVGGWLTLRRLAHGPCTAPDWQARARSLMARLGIRRPVRLVESARARVPAAVGVLRPVILLPVGLLTGIPAVQVEAILAHELAHVRRHDYLVNLLQTALETLLFYHPAVWWISARVRHEREACCDDLALTACGDRAAYARALTAVEQWRSAAATPPLSTLAPAADGGSLLARIRRLAGHEHPARPARTGGVLAGALIALGCATWVLCTSCRTTAQGAQAKPASPAATRPAAAAAPAPPMPSPADITRAAAIDPGIETIRRERDRVQAQIEEVSRTVGAMHPTIVSLRETLARFDRQLPERVSAALAGMPGNNSNAPQPSPLRPEDLVAKAEDYRIAPGDLLTVTIGDLLANGTDTPYGRRVSESGKITLPYVGEIPVAGLTVAELERAVAKAYRDKALIRDARVAVQVTEARANTYTILGPGTPRAGVYPLTRPDLRLPEALAQAGITARATTVRIMRGRGPDQRVIEVPLRDLLSGGQSANLVIRPGDMLLIADPQPTAVRVLVGPDRVTLDGRPVDEGVLPDAIRQAVSNVGAGAVLEVGATSDDVPIGRFMSVFGVCANTAAKLKDTHVSNVGVQRADPASRPATTRRADARVTGEYYIQGLLARPGVYAFNGRAPTLAQAIASAGGAGNGAKFFTLVHQTADGETQVLSNAPLDMNPTGHAAQIVLAPEDLVTISADHVPTATAIRPVRTAPHARDVGELYVAGHVRRPGVYSLTGKPLTLTRVLASAGGPDDSAADAVEIRRKNGNTEDTLSASLRRISAATDPDLYLEPNDEVNVTLNPAAPAVARPAP